MKKFNTCLAFNGNAEEAAKFYVSVFKNAKITDTMHYGDAGPGPKGDVLAVTFEMAGHEIIALNGPDFKYTPAVSLFVVCNDQAEVDAYWEKLTTTGGDVMACGWVTDKFGVTWQIVPSGLMEMLNDKNAKKSAAAMQAMMQMKKLDINAVRKAFDAA